MSAVELVPVAIPGASAPIQTDGQGLAALRPMAEALGLDYSGQLAKLRKKSWATMETFSTVGADGKVREMVGIDRRTVGMWLATLDEHRVAEDKRAELRAYQAEAADALDAYWHKGGVINPRANEHQVNALIFQSRAQLEMIQAAKGLIHSDHLEAQARVVLARGLGEHAVLDPATRPLYAQDFLKSKNVSSSRLKSIAPAFGKRIKKAHLERHGRPPERYPLVLPNGQTKDVNAYTEADRDLMEQVWDLHYAVGTQGVLG